MESLPEGKLVDGQLLNFNVPLFASATYRGFESGDAEQSIRDLIEAGMLDHGVMEEINGFMEGGFNKAGYSEEEAEKQGNPRRRYVGKFPDAAPDVPPPADEEPEPEYDGPFDRTSDGEEPCAEFDEALERWVEGTYGGWRQFEEKALESRKEPLEYAVEAAENMAEESFGELVDDFNESKLEQYLKPEDAAGAAVVSIRMPEVDLDKSAAHIIVVCKKTTTPEQQEAIKEWLVGQLADGWGEGAEQRRFSNGDWDCYYHFWSGDHKGQVTLAGTEPVKSGMKVITGKVVGKLKAMARRAKRLLPSLAAGAREVRRQFGRDEAVTRAARKIVQEVLPARWK